jgi:hypothetical protein
MAIRTTSLRGCDGFKVETADGLIGWVEEPWLGPDGEPAGLALRLLDGRHGFVLAEDVRLVEPDTEDVLLVAGASTRELTAPRLERLGDGETAPSPSPQSVPWGTIALIVAGLALLVAVEITLAFSVAKAVTGHAY